MDAAITDLRFLFSFFPSNSLHYCGPQATLLKKQERCDHSVLDSEAGPLWVFHCLFQRLGTSAVQQKVSNGGANLARAKKDFEHC